MNNSLPSSSGPEMDSVDLANAISGEPETDKQFFGLSHAQRTALEWLTSGGSVNDAAQSAGVCRQTVSRWLHGDPIFRDAYDAWREQVTAVASARLIALAESAVDNISTAIRQGHDVKTSQFLVKHLAAERRKRE